MTRYYRQKDQDSQQSHWRNGERDLYFERAALA